MSESPRRLTRSDTLPNNHHNRLYLFASLTKFDHLIPARLKDTLTFFPMSLKSSTGRKRRFGAAGVINLVSTNIILQLLLSSQLTPIVTATLISQAYNGIFGYSIYGKWVFKSKNLLRWPNQLSYTALMTSIWILNMLGIQALSSSAVGLSRNWAALAMITPLAMISYIIQKFAIFRT